MPPRLNKRQLRELEELKALEGASTPEVQEDVVSEEEEEVPAVKGAVGGFAALMAGGTDDESEEEAARPSKSKKKKKKKKATGTSTSAQAALAPHVDEIKADSPKPGPPAAESTISKKEKKALKKQKQKAAKSQEDDLDKALAELSMKYPELKQAAEAPQLSQSSSSLFSLLGASLSHLDGEAELRKFFGTRVVIASKSDSGSGSGPALAKRPLKGARSNLTRPKTGWGPATKRQGLSARLLTDQERTERNKRHGWSGDIIGERIWTVEYSKTYRGITRVFMHMVTIGDAEGIQNMLRDTAYHADTLLQMSEIYFHREEHNVAADLIDRALFAYERAFVGSFNFTGGNNRLDFDRVENRPFFLALHRQSTDLHRRGCVRTAFEFAKVLYGLDPSTDPHGALLHLDFFAIKAGMHQWLLDLWDAHCSLAGDEWRNRANVRALPGWAYSRALALFIDEEAKGDSTHRESSAVLLEAANAFPSVVPLLADKADITLPAEIRSSSSFKIHTDASALPRQSDAILHLLSHLYALRASSLWKTPSRSSWFATTVGSLASPGSPVSLSAPDKPTSPSPSLLHELYSTPLAYSIYRHVVVLESVTRAGRLFGFLPSHILQGRQYACDPLPPPTAVTRYDEAFFAGAEDPSATPQNRRRAAQMLERMLPNRHERELLVAIFAQNPELQQQFPGGALQFARAMAQLPVEDREDFFAIEAMRQGAGEVQMPGEIPGIDLFGDIGEEEAGREEGMLEAGGEGAPREVGDEDEEDEVEELPPLPVRFLHGIMNRLWGGQGAQDDDSSDDEAGPRDTGGVD